MIVVCVSCSESKISNRSESTPSIKTEEAAFIDRMDEKLYPMEEHFMARNYPKETFATEAYRSVMQEIKREKSNDFRTGLWKQEGPGNIGGRINTIAINPSNNNEILMGYSFGGIFKTTDKGENWYPVFDDQDIMSISDIYYDPQNPEIVYVATGDHNLTGSAFNGNGVFKSENGGETWNRIGLQETGVVSEIATSKNNSDIVYAATMGIPYVRTENRGLYKSTDAGATWENVFFLNDTTGVIDIEVHPTNPDVVYAATWTRLRNNRESLISSEETGIYKTIDGGENWTKMENGLPTGDLVRPGLAMLASDPDVVYASFTHYNTDTLCSVGFHLQGIYKTSNAGDSWETIPTGEITGLPCTVLGGFGWYFGKIRVNPTNENEIYILGVDLYNTNDSGLNWSRTTPSWATYSVHADKHDLVFDGDDILLATDGGAYIKDGLTDEWSDIENIVSTQFYRVAVSPFDEGSYYGGAQDNGSTGGNSEIINEWPRIFGGDGFEIVFHPTDSLIFYVETQNGNIRRTMDGGQSFQFASGGLFGTRNWDMQYIMSSVDPSMLYTGTDRMFRSVSDEVPNWLPISDILVDTMDAFTAVSRNITTLDESPVDAEILYCGTSDGLVWRSMDFGDSWERITNGLPKRYISDVKASRNDASTVLSYLYSD